MPNDLARVLTASRRGEGAAMAEAFEAAYAELRRLAHAQLRRLRPGQTLTTTSLVHEAFVKLVRRPVETVDQVHFFSLAARAMRQILVDYARQRGARKRGAHVRPETLEEGAVAAETLGDELLAIDDALTRLHAVDERLAQVVEWRFFGGMTEEAVADAMGVTARTVRRDWQKARAFLWRELQNAAD
jgi:RNA polymerase sigma factor (TIGR02999 family)